ncbi:hypothetical protein O0L34_g212 [Tuta absoluta]|nr:hypothetical protein O0L34_g212 [Tuta absoluta]
MSKRKPALRTSLSKSDAGASYRPADEPRGSRRLTASPSPAGGPAGQYRSQRTRLHIRTTNNSYKMSERTAFLIETVKNYPMLYDPTHEESKNAKLKSSIWNDIALIVGDNNGDATKARWRNLRDCYSKHLRSRNSIGPASKHTARYKTWPWVQQISYLEPFIGMETQCQNGYDSEKSTSNNQSKTNSEHSTQKCKSLKRSRDTDWQVDKVLSFLNSTSTADYDAIDLIFLGYSRTIKKFSPHRQALAKYNIAKVIMEAELEHIQEMSQTAVEFINGENRCDSPVEYIEPPEVKMETFGETLDDGLPNLDP